MKNEGAIRAKGVLHPWQRRLYGLLLIPLGLMAANSIYLVAFTKISSFFMGMLLMHLVLGVLIAIPFLVFAFTHGPRMLANIRNRKAKAAGITIVTLALTCIAHGRLHGPRGRDAHAPPRLPRARLRDTARADRLHPSPPRGRPQAALQAALPVGRRGGGVPRGHGDPPEAREAAAAHREQERRHAVLPLLGRDVRPGPPRREEVRREPVLPGVPPRLLQALGEGRPPLLVLQQPLLPPRRRADGRPRRPREDEVVRRLPRSRRPLHGSDGQGHDGVLLVRPVRGAAGARLHGVPRDRRDEGRPRQRRLRRGGEQAVPVRVHEEQGAQRGQQAPHPHGALAPSRDLHEAVHADAGVLRDVPQGRPPAAAQRVPLAARPEPLRPVAGLGRVRLRGALVLRPAADEGLPRLPPAAHRLPGVRQPERKAPRPPLPGGEHGAPGVPRRQRHDRGHSKEDPGRIALHRRVRDQARREDDSARPDAASREARRDGGRGSRDPHAHARPPVHERHRRQQRVVGRVPCEKRREKPHGVGHARREPEARPGGQQAEPARHRTRRDRDGPATAAGHPRPALQQRDRARRRARRPLPLQGARRRERLRHALGRRRTTASSRATIRSSSMARTRYRFRSRASPPTP